MRGMKWYMRLLLAVTFALLLVGGGLSIVQAKDNIDNIIVPQWTECWEGACETIIGCAPNHLARLKCCYSDGVGWRCWFVCGCN